MTDSAALARQLAELDKVATPGPWIEDDGNFFSAAEGHENDELLDLSGDDYELLTTLRNNLPAILRALCVMAAVDEEREIIGSRRYGNLLERADQILTSLGAKNA